MIKKDKRMIMTGKGNVMPKAKVYLETSFISYLTAEPSDDILRKAKQIATQAFWRCRDNYDLMISDAVLAEIKNGNPDDAAKRLLSVQGINVVESSETTDNLAIALTFAKAVPPSKLTDAYHIACASVNFADYLLTWNQKHIDNPVKLQQIITLIQSFNLRPPVILSPERLLIMEKLK
jgi:hypothetical protein